MRYRIQRLEAPLTVDADWDKSAWAEADTLSLEHHMGERPPHFPATRARLAWDREALYVIFRVDDRYVRAVAAAHQNRVCSDSCVEFFFSPGADPAEGYFNIEMNCGGTLLFHFQKMPRQGAVNIPSGHIESMSIAHTMPFRVDPEIKDPVAWLVEYKLPFFVLEGYRPIQRPEPGAVWRANFYKCADETSHPHWLTWAPVESPKPDFHVPASFGVLEFA